MKKIILLICTLFLTGCSVEYNLTIDENGLKESIDAYTNDLNNLDVEQPEYYNLTKREIFDDLKDSYQRLYFNDENYDPNTLEKQNNVLYYDIKSLDDEKKYGISAIGEFNINTIYRSLAIKTCFNEITVSKNDEYQSLKTNGRCKVFEDFPLINKLIIRIETDYNSIYNNADIVDENSYTWILTKDNYQSKNISFLFDIAEDKVPNVVDKEEKKDNVEDLKKEETKSSNHVGLLILGSFAVFIIVVILIAVFKKKKF